MTVLEVEPLVGEDGEVREITMEDLKFARRGRPTMPEETRKKRVSIMLDPEIIDRLKSDGKGWQTRANSLLRKALAL